MARLATKAIRPQPPPAPAARAPHGAAASPRAWDTRPPQETPEDLRPARSARGLPLTDASAAAGEAAPAAAGDGGAEAAGVWAPQRMEIRVRTPGRDSGGGYLGGLQSDIQSLGARAAALSHDARRRSRALQRSGSGGGTPMLAVPAAPPAAAAASE